METYDNIILKRIGYILFIIVLAVEIFNIGGGNAETMAKSPVVRKTVTFGTFDLDNNPDNGQEPIEWIVLEEKDGKCLLLSKCGLDSVAYHADNGDADWEHCSLRAWLNKDFLQSSFTGDEQAAIQVTKVTNSSQQGAKYSCDAGADTEDRIFMLSYREAFLQYFASPEDRLCEPSQSAVAHGVFYTETSKSDPASGCSWWLRSPADRLGNALLTEYSGTESFSDIHFANSAVRPALWVNADALKLQ